MNGTRFSEQIRAKTWDDYVGQTAMKERLNIIIESAVIGRQMLDAMMFTAPPGMGKTTIAKIVADQVGDKFHSFRMPISIDALVRFVEDWEGGILLLDEIHAAGPEMQRALLGAIEDHKLGAKGGWAVGTHHITFLAATTEPEKILDPLWDRFTYTPWFAPYTDDEMCQVITGMAERADVDIDPDVVAGLGRAAGGTPRIAGTLIAAARDLARTERDVTVGSVLRLAGVDQDGLTDRHIEYLAVLKTLGSRSGEKNIARMLRVSHRTVEELERLLITRGYVELRPNGRVLTSLAREKLAGPSGSAERNPVARRRMPVAS